MHWPIKPFREKTSSSKTDPVPGGASVGAWIAKMGGHNFWEMAGYARDQWILLAAEIKNILDEQSDPVPQSVLWSGYMVGKTTTTARPTAIFCSKDATSRRTVRDLVRGSRLLEKYPGFITAERSHPPDFGKLMPLQDKHTGDLQWANSSFSNGMVYFETPAGVRQATIGGVVCIRNLKFYLTVGHLFTETSGFSSWDSTNEEEEGELDIDEDEDGAGNEAVDQAEDDLAAITSTASISPPLSSNSDETTSSSVPLPSISESYQRPERSPGTDSESIPVSSPPQTAPNLPPTSNSSTSAAPGMAVARTSRPKVLLSTTRAGTTLGLDYALLEVPEEEADRADKYVVVQPPVDRGSDEPHATDVVALAARNALVPGRLAATPSFITSGAGRGTQEIWKVRLNGPLASGDCGMWIVDAQNRELYGHVVAGNPDLGVAYIVPAYQVFSDITDRFGHVSLPSPPARVISSLLHQALRRVLPRDASLRILMVGLDAAGKTSLLGVLTTGELPTTIPTIGFNVESIKKGNVTLDIWDLGGGDKIRPLWKHYCPNTDTVVFVVDLTDRERALEARFELHRLLQNGALLGAPLLVLGNKSDRSGGFTIDELAEILELDTIQDREVAYYSVSALEGTNLDLVLRWLIARMMK